MKRSENSNHSTISDSRISDVEFRMLLLAARSGRDRLILRLFYGLGLNLNELTNLKPTDIDLKKKTITIRTTKSGVSRTLSLSLPLVAAIRAHRSKEYLFYSRQSAQITNRRVEQIIVGISKRAGLKSITPREFRKAFIRNSFEKGMDQDAVQKTIGTCALRFKKFVRPKIIDSVIDKIQSMRDRAIISILKETGCKVTDIVRLKGRDIDPVDKTITLGNRRFRISGSLLRILGKVGPDEHLFTTRQSSRITVRRVEQLIKRYLADQGIEATSRNIRYARTAERDISEKDNFVPVQEKGGGT